MVDEAIQISGKAIDVLGVLVIVSGTVGALVLLLFRLLRRDRPLESYRRGRQNLGRVILLGLELLVAGDIIRTVAVSPTFRSVGVLAGIVAIRTFLSVSLEMEIRGRWPWQREKEPAPPPATV